MTSALVGSEPPLSLSITTTWKRPPLSLSPSITTNRKNPPLSLSLHHHHTEEY
ncbi:hypothetical protein DPEC_G00126300, partial [Dallia pectoralis]